MRVYILAILFVFVSHATVASTNNVADIKLISYYEESPREYRFYFTLYKNTNIKILIQYLNKDDYIYEGKLSEKETKRIFSLANNIEFTNPLYLKLIPRGSGSFRLEVLYVNELKIIHTHLNNVNQSEKVFLLHEEIKKFLR